jgi:ethanolamine utilization protein EutQ
MEAVQRYGFDAVSGWYQANGVEMAIGDAVDPSNSDSMSVGFARYGKGAANAWTLTYDEALAIVKGRFTVESDTGPHTAAAGEVIFLRRGTRVVYRADEDTELVYVTHPHWLEATERSELAAQLADYHSVPAAAAARIAA